MNQKIKSLIFHPFLFAIYPPLFLLEHNLHELEPIEGLRAILVSLIVSAVIFLVLRLILKNWQRAALVTTVFMVMFYAYGHVRSVIPEVMVGGVPVYAHRYTFPVWIVLTLLFMWLAGWKVKKPGEITPYLNILGLVLIVTVVVQGAVYVFQFGQGLSAKTQNKLKELGISTVTDKLNPPPQEEMRDIYYIISDGYSRNDVILNEYGYDNSDFTDALKDRGFYVADCSSSNYDYTVFSLSSALDLNYVHRFAGHLLRGHDWRDFSEYFRHNVVRDTLIELGYKTVAFDTVTRWTLVENSDYFITLKKKTSLMETLMGGVTEFEDLLMDTTLLARRNTVIKWITGVDPSTLKDAGGQEVLSGVPPALYPERYAIIQNNLEKLQEIPSYPGKKFIYAHLMSTHRPFYFDKDGSFNPTFSTEGYINSTIYTNKMLLEAVDKIIAETDPDPIIIIQGDHSRTGSKDPFGVLNAYYLPDGGTELLYPTISPVNSFRVIFNYYFGADFPLIEDISFDWYKQRDMITFEEVPHTAPCYK